MNDIKKESNNPITALADMLPDCFFPESSLPEVLIYIALTHRKESL